MSLRQCMLFLVVAILTNLINSSTTNIESTTESWTDRIAAGAQKLHAAFEKDTRELKLGREELEKDKQISKPADKTDVFQLNVGGQIISATRQTLTKIPKSFLCLLFYGRWEHKLQRDKEGNIFLDFNPIVFRHLLDQLQMVEIDNSFHLYPPSQPSLIETFKKMLRRLGLNHLLSSEKKNIITFNIGGQTITSQRTTFINVSNSIYDTIVPSSKTINFNNESDVFLDYDPKLFQNLINQLREESFKSISPWKLSSNKERISFKTMLIDLSIFVVEATTTTSTTTRTASSTTKMIKTTSASTTTTKQIFSSSSSFQISNNTKWKQNGITIAVGNRQGSESNRLYLPHGIYVDDDNQCIYISDHWDHCIIEWNYDTQISKIVAGGNGIGNQMNQLNLPKGVTVDKKSDSLIICDQGNQRVVRWPRRNGANGETIISDIDCSALSMDKNGDLYVSDCTENEVRRWKIGEQEGIIVAGGRRKGSQMNQFNQPRHFFINKEYSIYAADFHNNRIMKWAKGAKEGIVVAGGQGSGNSLRQLYYPEGVIVDDFDNVYVADSYNDRIVCWSKGSKEGRIIVGGNGEGNKANQFNSPKGLSFDRQGNLYVIDLGNYRVQKFEIDRN